MAGKHRGDDDHSREQEPVFVVRRPKLLKGQRPIHGFFQQRNKLPVVHEWDVYGELVNVSEKSHRRQKADDNQERLADFGAKDERGDPVQEGTLCSKKGIDQISNRFVTPSPHLA